jgi:predicted O-methyltransferase YrrM
VKDTPAWTVFDRYIEEHLIGPDPTLEACLRSSAEEGLPPIAVSAAQGKLLHVLARSISARRILEIGTLGGYSAIWMGRALPFKGELVTLEINPANAAVAQRNIAFAGLAGQTRVIVGPALDSMRGLEGPFDLIFIDANKDESLEYFTLALALSRPGGLIVVDNVVREGRVLDPSNDDPNLVGIRRLFDALAQERRVTATAIQTVGDKGYDGFLIAVVN